MTIASALDHLTDVLANKDVAGYQTIEQSINNISDMIEDGEISLGGSISPATADTLGGVKIGEGISVTSDGTISAGGGYDAVIKITVPESSSDPVTLEALSGTYAGLVSKYNDGGFVNVKVIMEDKMTMGCITYGYCDAGFANVEGSGYIVIDFYDVGTPEVVTLVWRSDGTIAYID